MKKKCITIFLILALPEAAYSQDAQFQNACELKPITDFDFWVGDWVAFDFNTGVVQGIDRVEKINNGCVVYQEWSQMTERYRPPGAPYKYAGISFNSVLPDGSWQQVWVGNGGGTIAITGGLNEEGIMVLASPETTAGNGTVFKRVWYWDPQEDGTIHSWGEIFTKNADGSWNDPQIPWNLRYVPRGAAPDLVAKGK